MDLGDLSSFGGGGGGFGTVAPTRAMDGSQVSVTHEKTDQVSISFFKAYSTTGWNAFPLGLIAVDIGLSMSGFAVVFNTPLSGWGILAWIMFLVASFVVSEAQVFMIYMAKEAVLRIMANKGMPKSLRKPIFMIIVGALGMIGVWTLDQFLDWMGYTYATTQNLAWARHVIPPEEARDPGFWIGGWAIWILGLISEPVRAFRIRYGPGRKS